MFEDFKARLRYVRVDFVADASREEEHFDSRFSRGDVEVAVFLHQLHGVDFAHRVRPDVGRNPVRPRRPLYVLPYRLSRPVLPIIPRRRKRPKPRPAMRGLVYVPPLSLRHIWLCSPANLINQRSRQSYVPPLPGLSLCNPHLFTKRKRQTQGIPYP